MVKKVIATLADGMETNIHADSIHVNVFDDIYLQNFYIEDHQQDTLLFVEDLRVDVNVLQIFGQRIAVKEVSLEDAYINTYKVDENTFNYQFVIDYFKKAEEDTISVDKKPLSWDIDLQKISLKSIQYYLENVFKDEILYVRLGEGLIDVENLDLKEQKISLSNVDITQPQVQFRQAGRGDDDDDEEIEEIVIDENVELEETEEPAPLLSIGDWTLMVENLELREGLAIIQQGDPDFTNDGSIDFENLELAPIHIQAQDISFHQDTLQVQLSGLELKDISGFEVNQLQGQLFLCNQHAHLQDFALKTPHSEVGDFLEFKYKDLRDWEDIVEKIYLNADLKESRIGIQDLEYFILAMARNDIADRLGSLEQIALEGKIKGKIKNLRGSDIKMRAGKHTYFAGDVRLRGLPDIDNTFINFKVEKLRTRMEDWMSFFPTTKFPKNITSLGDIRFEGYFTGYHNDFVAQGALTSDIGSVTTDLNMKINDIARYSGEVVLKDFDLRTFLNNDDFGFASFKTDVKGQGIKINELFAEIDGNIETFDFKGYRYQNVMVDGMVDRKLFKGQFSANDENFNLTFDGAINFNDSIPKIKFETEVFALDLKKLQLSKEDIVIKGLADLNFEGNNIDNLVGKGRFEKLQLIRNDSLYKFDAFTLNATENKKGERLIHLDSDYLIAFFKGDFSFKTLPNQVKHTLHHYLPNYFKEVEMLAEEPADIEVGIQIVKPIKFTRLLHPKLDYVSSGHIKGQFNKESNQVELETKIKKVIFDDITFQDISLNIGSSSEHLMVGAALEEISKNPTLTVNDVYLSADVYQDTIQFNLQAEEDTAYNNLDFEGYFITTSDTLRLHIDSINLTVADKLWETSGGIAEYLNKDYFLIEDFALQHKDQSIAIEGAVSEVFKNEIKVDLNDIRIDELMQLLDQEKLRMEGIANGQVQIQNVFEMPILTGDVEVETFTMMDQELGKVVINAEKENGRNKILLAASVDGKGYHAKADGFLNLDGTPQLDINLDAQQLSASFLEGLIGESIANTSGFGTGKVRIHGNPNAPDIDGQLYMYGGGTTITYLNTSYSAVNDTLYFQGKKVRFEDIELNDKYGNKAFLNGELDLNNFKDLSTDVTIISDNFLFMDTKKEDNEYLYGTALASGTVHIHGFFKDIVMDIYTRSKEGTVLYIPVTYETDVVEENFFTFTNTQKDKKKDQNNAEEEAGSSNTLTMNMNLDITTDAEIQMIFDYQAGDIIRSRGLGDLQIEMKTNEDIRMYGNYTIDQGDYLFTLQNIVNKKFILEKGGTIDFFGNPYDALLDLDAVYRVKNTSLKELSSDASDFDDGSGDAFDPTVNTDVLLHLSGILSSPNIDFTIDIPGAPPSLFTSSALRRIEELNNDSDKNELNRQVFGLLVFNEFLPQQSLLSNDFVQSGIYTTLSEFISNQITSLLSQTIQEIIPNSDLSFDWDYSSEGDLIDPTGNLQDARNEIELVYTQRLLNNRIILDIGSNFNVGENSTNEWNTLISDFVIQYKITDDGHYWVKLFSKNDYNVLLGNYNRTGVSLFFTEEFDDFKDLIQTFKQRRANRKKLKLEKKQKKNQRQKNTVPPNPSDPTPEEKPEARN